MNRRILHASNASLLIFSFITHNYINAADRGKHKVLNLGHTALYELEQRPALSDKLEQRPSKASSIEQQSTLLQRLQKTLEKEQPPANPNNLKKRKLEEPHTEQ